MLTRAHGNVTDEHVERVGKLSGPMGSLLDQVFAKNLGETYVTRSKKGDQDQQVNLVRDMIRVYQADKLVSFQGKREHKSFGRKVLFKTEVEDTSLFKMRLLNHAKRTDIMTGLLPQYEDKELAENEEEDNMPLLENDTDGEEVEEY